MDRECRAPPQPVPGAKAAAADRDKREWGNGPPLAVFYRATLVLMLTAAGLGPTTGATNAQMTNLATAAAVQVSHIQAMDSGKALLVTPQELDLGILKAGQPVALPQAVRILNGSRRPLQLTATVKGIPGLKAAVHPTVIAPQEFGWVNLSGRPWNLGPQAGHLEIEALNGFLRQRVPLAVQVQFPALTIPGPSRPSPRTPVPLLLRPLPPGSNPPGYKPPPMELHPVPPSQPMAPRPGAPSLERGESR